MDNTNKTLTAVSVILTSGVERSLADLTADPSYTCDVQKVVWSDGSRSWGKAWSYWTGDRRVLAKVGAGAYGTKIVWTNAALPASVLWR